MQSASDLSASLQIKVGYISTNCIVQSVDGFRRRKSYQSLDQLPLLVFRSRYVMNSHLRTQLPRLSFQAQIAHIHTKKAFQHQHHHSCLHCLLCFFYLSLLAASVFTFNIYGPNNTKIISKVCPPHRAYKALLVTLATMLKLNNISC